MDLDKQNNMKKDLLKDKLAIVFERGERKGEYKSYIIKNYRPMCGSTIDGIIWLRRPTWEERVSIVPMIHQNGFEIMMFEIDKSTEISTLAP